MPKVLYIAMLIVLPLLWGLAVEYVFERVRRRRASANNQAEKEPTNE